MKEKGKNESNKKKLEVKNVFPTNSAFYFNSNSAAVKYVAQVILLSGHFFL